MDTASTSLCSMDKPSLSAAVSMESLASISDSSPQVRTLFVSGLPMDAKPRELYLLFRAYHGYENSLLKMTAKNGKATSPVGFVTFATRQDADDCRKALQGVRFDPDCAQTIRLELARSNTKVSRPKQSPPPAAAPAGGGGFLAPYQPEIVLDHVPMVNEHQLLALSMPHLQNQMYLQQQQNMLQMAANPQLQLYTAALAAQQQAQAAQQLGQLNAATASPACSTLFVANLGQHCAEEEVRALFKSLPGFIRLRMHTKGGSSVAFVEYGDIRQASTAMLTLQGATVSSSERGGIRIEYARNKMADVNG